MAKQQDTAHHLSYRSLTVTELQHVSHLLHGARVGVPATAPREHNRLTDRVRSTARHLQARSLGASSRTPARRAPLATPRALRGIR
jgi:hypothetical protein